MAQVEQSGTGGNVLVQRLGPLATWVWLLIVTLVVGGIALYSRHKAAAQQGQAQPGQVAGDQQVPDIILQNYVQNQQQATTPVTVNVPPEGAEPPSTQPPPKPGGPPGKRPPPRKGPPPKRKPAYRIVTVSRWTRRNTPWSSTLSGIAEHYEVPGGVQQLAKINHIKNPNLIHPGQKIRVPA